jgi:hypothetical protein
MKMKMLFHSQDISLSTQSSVWHVQCNEFDIAIYCTTDF